MSTKYRVHRFDLRVTAVPSKRRLFLNSLGGESIAITPGQRQPANTQGE